MNDTLQSPALTEDLLLVLDEMEDASIPCTGGTATVFFGVPVWDEPPCQNPCGHQGHLCERHYQERQVTDLPIVCRACNAVCEYSEVKWRRL
jgi:hypothetical protein